MLTYDLTQRGKTPLYDYLYQKIRDDILSKRLKAGDRLPSKRTLAYHHKVSVITVENAYAQLIAEGYIYAVEKTGYFVSHLEYMPLLPAVSQSAVRSKEKSEPLLLDLTSRSVADESFPFSVWSKLTRRVLSSEHEKLLSPLPHNGIDELRCAIADYLYRFRGMSVAKEQIVIGSGTEYLYTLLIQLFGKDHMFVTENPGYKKIARIFESCGAKWMYADMDESGINPDCFKNSTASVLHISPTHHYPTGIGMPASRRSEILSWAYEKEERYIIEDDYDSEFRFAGKPLPPLFTLDHGARVIYINTFSKTIAPSMRISYMVLPKTLLSKYNERLGFYSCTVPGLEQYTLAAFIAEGYFEKHILRMKNSYRILHDEIMNRIIESPLSKKLDITEEISGLHFLIHIDTSLSDDELKHKLLSHGIQVNFLSDYAYSNDAKFSHTMVFNYSGIHLPDLEKALLILNTII